ncbi:prolipoprotein diacylglyceryl transferase [Angustibacter luteus]|uniref:Phosphatidylglycerol--prolipoprotein diacylglyceryl transferase n=1 Tax=Angustibacter luteus TaxID=658456 RepID=A0ABW1JAC4_9ACTN
MNAALPATIPSPAQGVWHLGPLPVRAYALCILIGIALAVWIATKRWRDRGGPEGAVMDISAWAVPFGIIGARVYHVATTWQPYFASGGHPLDALKIWNGGLGIWGAVAGGALGAWIACRRKGVSFLMFADAAAPGVAVAQAAGRLGNYFNNEIYGRQTDLPWGLRVHEWNAATGEAVRDANGHAVLLPGAYHPTFLYEAIWCLLVAGALVLLDRRYHLDRGRTLALYVMLYTVGRFAIETLRSDTANLILGHRLNEWTSVIVFLGGLVLFVVQTRKVRKASHDADEIPEAQDV